MDNKDEIFDKALGLLKAGHSKDEVLAELGDYKNELAPLLELSQSLFGMPKNIVPTPLMQRKYALSRVKLWWMEWTHISKLAAASTGLMLILAAGAATAYAAWNSLPGNNLFALKKAGEQAELVFAMSDQAKANLQVELAQKRLAEAQQVFSDPQSNVQEQTAALNELGSQTSNAVATLNSVAQNDPQAQSNHPLLSSLENVTQAQQTFLTQINSNNQIKSAAASALKTLSSNTSQLALIKETVAVADSDQTLTALNATSTAVAVLGTVNQVSASQITVEKTTFTLNDQTQISDTDGNNLTAADLIVGEQVNAVGQQQKNSLLAQQILITKTAPLADSNSSTSTATSTLADISAPSATSTTSTSSAIISAAVSKKSASTQSNADSDNSTIATDTDIVLPIVNPNIASGGFILEDPAPQFHP